MGIQSSHIFLRRYAMNALPDALEKIWTDSAPEPSRQLFALFPKPPPPPRDASASEPRPDPSWTTLLELKSAFSACMAEEICRAIRGEVVFARVDSAAFSLHLERFEDGKRVEKLALPDAGSPPFIDAEQLGWEEMARRGIPPQLRYLRLDQLEIMPLTGNNSGHMALYLHRGEDSLPMAGYCHYRIRQPRRESEGAPPVFNMFDGKDMLVDVYTPPGSDDGAGLEQLLASLDVIARRKRPPKFRYAAAVQFTAGDPSARDARKQLLLKHYRRLTAEQELAFELL